MKESTRRNINVTIWIVLIVALLAFIWHNSMQSPIDSAELSGKVMKIISPFLEIFVGKGNVTQYLVRKLAHFTEFFMLGFLSMGLSAALRGRRNLKFSNIFIPLSCAMFAAAIDETIQIFFERGSSLADVWLDFSGAVIGAFIVLIFRLLFNKR